MQASHTYLLSVEVFTLRPVANVELAFTAMSVAGWLIMFVTT